VSKARATVQPRKRAGGKSAGRKAPQDHLAQVARAPLAGVEEQKTKDRILLAAVKVFGVRGFQGARTVEIAKVANVPQPLLYFHFSNKIDLWNACAEYSISTTANREEIVTKHLRSLKPEDALDFLITNLVRRAHDHPDTARFYIRFGIEQELNPSLASNPSYTKGLELFRSNVKYLQDNGVLSSEIDATIMSYMLIGSATQIYWNHSDFQSLTGVSSREESIMDRHLKAMLRLFSQKAG
jgi:AcrR family transcriptional regulator